MERHVEGVVERQVLRVGEIEALLDALLEDRPRQRLVDVEGVAVAVELAGYGRSHVDGQRGHRRQEEALDVVAAQDADHVGTRGFEAALGFRVPRVDAQDHVAVLGLRADEELRRVRQGSGGAERHGPMLGQNQAIGQAGRARGKRLLRLGRVGYN